MDNNKFCPIVKDVCKDEICMAWEGDNCMVFTFLKHLDNSDHLIPGSSYGLREQILKDEEKAEQLLPECIEWAQSKKITRPTREEIRTFLVVKGAPLCETAMRSLWRQVKAKLRESKRELDYLASQKWSENSSNVGLAWSSDEDDALIKGFDLGKSCFDLSKIHKRSIRAIELRLVKFGKVQLVK